MNFLLEIKWNKLIAKFLIHKIPKWGIKAGNMLVVVIVELLIKVSTALFLSFYYKWYKVILYTHFYNGTY